MAAGLSVGSAVIFHKNSPLSLLKYRAWRAIADRWRSRAVAITEKGELKDGACTNDDLKAA